MIKIGVGVDFFYLKNFLEKTILAFLKYVSFFVYFKDWFFKSICYSLHCFEGLRSDNLDLRLGLGLGLKALGRVRAPIYIWTIFGGPSAPSDVNGAGNLSFLLFFFDFFLQKFITYLLHSPQFDSDRPIFFPRSEFT